MARPESGVRHEDGPVAVAFLSSLLVAAFSLFIANTFCTF